MCDICEAIKAQAAHGGQTHVMTANDAAGARRSANEIWQYAARETAAVHNDLMRVVSQKTFAAVKSGDKLSAAIYSLASTALVELLARRLEHEAAAETAAAN